MKVPVIKSLVQAYSVDALRHAEQNLVDGIPIGIAVEGEDEGQQLTHVMAAIFILEQMDQKAHTFQEALRLYSQKVRASLS